LIELTTLLYYIYLLQEYGIMPYGSYGSNASNYLKKDFI
jgi:hypothetical protein